MRKLVKAVAAAAAVLFVNAAALAAQSTSVDTAGVRTAVEAYLRAHATGSGTHIQNVFHPQLRMMWVAAGDTLSSRSAAQYIAGFRGQPQPDETERRRWIESVDITGNAAVAKVILDYPDRRFTDYFSLLRMNGEWQIVSKVFTSEPKR
jgi:hypothetical protein